MSDPKLARALPLVTACSCSRAAKLHMDETMHPHSKEYHRSNPQGTI